MTVTASVAACSSAERTRAIGQAVQQIVSSPKAVPPEVRTFYEQVEAPAWVTAAKTTRAAEALRVLQRAPEHGLNPADYAASDLAERIAALETLSDDDARIQPLAELDVLVTRAMLEFGRDVAIGRTLPSSLDPRWKAQRSAPDVGGALVRAVRDDVTAWPDTIQPSHPEYAWLKDALRQLQAQRDMPWPQIPAARLRPGESDPAVVSLRQRLVISGQDSVVSTSSVYDRDVEEGVRNFQERYGLTPNGVADAATIAAMNVSVDDRIAQVERNLERWRWMPENLGERYLFVNIPAYELVARERGDTVLAMRVIVGKPSLSTPVFSSEMTTVVFSPFWNIPESIVEGEMVPAAANDPDYLARRGIEVVRRTKSGATPVDPATVNWGDSEDLQQFSLRQRPGPQNALGHVKFLFPSAYDIYLHDTPGDSLFARSERALSHGCVRIEKPEDLARYLLRDDPKWTDARISKAMGSGNEEAVALADKLPVHIGYFTAWVDDAGRLNFRPDIYNLDRVAATRPHSLHRSARHRAGGIL